MNYTTITELLMDDGFLAWHSGKDDRQAAIWNKWIAESDQNRLLAEKAVMFLQELTAVGEREGTQQDVSVIWAQIQARIQRQERATNYPSLFGSFVDRRAHV